jgi:ABC-type dipeptide/oligopeptide/nickel transport system ATPase component
MLKLENIEINFATSRGNLHAVKGVTLDIAAGESIGIFG